MRNISFSASEYILLAILFLTEFTRGAFFLTFWPLFAVHYLGLSIFTAGLAVSAHYLIETLTKWPAGMKFDRYGRPVMVTGLILAVLSLLGLRYAPNSTLMIICAGFFGLGVSPIWVAVISRVAPVQAPDRAARMGAVFSVWLIGAGSGPVSISFILSLGYAQTYWCITGLWLVILMLAILWPQPANQNNFQYSLKEEFKKLSGNIAFTRILMPGMFLQTLAASMLLPILPIFARENLGLNTNQYGFLLMTGGGAAVLLLIPMGKLADRVNLRYLLTTGFGLSALFIGLLTVTKGTTAVFFLAALAGAAYAVVLPAWNSLMAKVIPPERQAAGWGLFSTLEGLGVATGPALGSLVANLIGPNGTIISSAAILAAMAVFYTLCPMNKHFQ